MAKTSRNKMNMKVSKLFAVTLFTPNNIVLNNFPWEVLKLFLSTYAMHPLSEAASKYSLIEKDC